MARPIDQDKRRALAKQAIEVMRLEGLSVSNTRLAEAMGIKRPTLLYYFPDRNRIVETALEELLTEQARFVVPRMAAFTHPIDQLYEQVRSVHAFHEGNEARLLFLSQAVATVGSERTAEIIKIGNLVFEAHRRALVARLERGIDQGTVRSCDPESLVRLCRAMIDGLVVQRVMTGCDLAPIHQLLWDSVLAPLKITPDPEDPNS